MFLPPATPAQVRQIYSLLHVTPAMVRLDRTYDYLYFASVFLHFVVRIGFLALGFSATFRNISDRLSERLLAFGAVRRFQAGIDKWILLLPLIQVQVVAIGAQWSKSAPGKFLARFSRLWQPQLFRSAFIYYLLYTFVFTLFWLPLSFYEGFVLTHRFGLSHESLLSWSGDLAKDTAVDALIGAFFVTLIVWGIAIFPKRWATILAMWSAPIILVGIFLNPLFDQIDNHFTRLPMSSVLYAPLHRLADHAGVPGAVILVSDKSKQTEETNAYVTGLGSTAQIVLWDTTIQKMKPDEVVAIVGHELGHYVEHHVIYGGLLASLAMFLFIPAIKVMSEAILRRWGEKWKINSLADPAALPILIISLSILTFVVSPATNAVSRYIEHRADSFGLDVTGNRLAMARAMVDLTNQNMDDPNPPEWRTFLLADHPTFGERIHFVLYGQPFNGPIKR